MGKYGMVMNLQIEYIANSWWQSSKKDYGDK